MKKTSEPEHPAQDRRVNRRSFLERMSALTLVGTGVSLPEVSLTSDRSPTRTPSSIRPPHNVQLPQVSDPTDYTLSEATAAIRQGTLSAAELVEACLRRIGAHDGALKAFNSVRHEEALEEARALDGLGHPRGLLHGAPLAIKDNYCTAGTPTTANSLIFADYVPDFDATTVAALKASGAVVLGKTQMGPLATTRATTPEGEVTTRNAWAPEDTDISPGGSSSGSATAVAARMASSSTGTQTGGSITSPSLAQGLTGLKPTMGRVSLHGIIPLTYTRDHPGPLARDARDAALMLQVMAGPDRRDHRTLGLPPVPDYIRAGTPSEPGTLRWPVTIGVLPEYLDEGDSERDRATASARRDMLSQFRTLGARVVEVPLPADWETLTSFNLNNVRLPERTEPFLSYLKEDVRLFGVSLSPWINGLLLSGDEYLKGQRAKVALLARMLTTFFERCDVLAVPSHLPFDMVGLPLIAFPIGSDNSRGVQLPVGGMLAGAPFGEEQLLSVVAGYQATTEHHLLRPSDPSPGNAPGGTTRRLDTWEVDAYGA